MHVTAAGVRPPSLTNIHGRGELTARLRRARPRRAASRRSATALAELADEALAEVSKLRTLPPPPVIGCYELRYGQGDPNTSSDDVEQCVTPDDFTRYMLYVTQWRWMQCEAYAKRHGQLGFWSMVHDLSCPQGFLALWSQARHVFNKYMTPVEEACGGLFPPMVNKILIVNVPRIFAPIWSVISMMLPEQHKQKIVLMTASQTTPAELRKYMPDEHIPPHVRASAGEATPTRASPAAAQRVGDLDPD